MLMFDNTSEIFAVKDEELFEQKFHKSSTFTSRISSSSLEV